VARTYTREYVRERNFTREAVCAHEGTSEAAPVLHQVAAFMLAAGTSSRLLRASGSELASRTRKHTGDRTADARRSGRRRPSHEEQSMAPLT